MSVRATANTMNVYDEETGEELTIPWNKRATVKKKKPTLRDVFASPYSIYDDEDKTAPKKKKNTPSDPITQSRLRQLGDRTGWTEKNLKREERREAKFNASLHGKQFKVKYDKTVPRHDREALEIEILEMIRTEYQSQKEKIILNEIQREIRREVDIQFENTALGQQRLHRQHTSERAKYKSQIERISEECELALAARMVALDLLR